jgi:uncharacterized membrane protein YbhN (UPF0104 family)
MERFGVECTGMSISVDTPSGGARVAPRWRTRLARWLLMGVFLYVVMTWVAGGAQTWEAVRRIGPAWFALGLGLTTLNFVLRGARWQMLLAARGARVSLGASFSIYLAGIALSATPGKAGETVRSLFLLRHGVRVGTSLAMFVVDRLSDLLGVLLVALVASVMAGSVADASVSRWLWALALTLGASLVARWLVRTGGWRRLAAAFGAWPRLSHAGAWIAHGGEDFLALWRPALGSVSLALSFIAYGLQGCIFAGMVAQLAPSVSFWTALTIFAASTLAGAVSMMPGGIGAMELSLVLMLHAEGVDPASGLAAALCLRAVTFWFGLLLGLVGLGIAAKEHHGPAFDTSAR